MSNATLKKARLCLLFVLYYETALVLCVPEQAQSPDTLLSPAGLHTLLYTSTPPAPGIAANTNITLTQLRAHIHTLIHNHTVSSGEIRWWAWRFETSDPLFPQFPASQCGGRWETASHCRWVHGCSSDLAPKINLVASASFKLKA